MPPRRAVSRVANVLAEVKEPSPTAAHPLESASARLRGALSAAAAAASAPHVVTGEIVRMLQHSSDEAHRAARDHRKTVAVVERRKRKARREAEILPTSVLLDIVKGRGAAPETLVNGCVSTLQQLHNKEAPAVPSKRMRCKGRSRFLLAPSPSRNPLPSGSRMLCDDGQPSAGTAPTHSVPPSPVLSSHADEDVAGGHADDEGSDGASVATRFFSDEDLWGAFCDTDIAHGEGAETGRVSVGQYSPSSPC